MIWPLTSNYYINIFYSRLCLEEFSFVSWCFNLVRVRILLFLFWYLTASLCVYLVIFDWYAWHAFLQLTLRSIIIWQNRILLELRNSKPQKCFLTYHYHLSFKSWYEIFLGLYLFSHIFHARQLPADCQCVIGEGT